MSPLETSEGCQTAHAQYSSPHYCNHQSSDWMNYKSSSLKNHYTFCAVFSQDPAQYIHTVFRCAWKIAPWAVETPSDRLMVKAPQLIDDCTTNPCKNFMCIRCKMDGGKFYYCIQRGSFYYRSMAAEVPEEDPSTLCTAWRPTGFPIFGNLSSTWIQCWPWCWYIRLVWFGFP